MEAPGDFFQTLLGFRARRARDIERAPNIRCLLLITALSEQIMSVWTCADPLSSSKREQAMTWDTTQ